MKKAKWLLFFLSAILAQPVWAACNNSLIRVKPNVIYQDNSNGTVTDLKTGLMWQKCSVGLSGNNCQTGTAELLVWRDALNKSVEINSAGFAGYNDWRLPNVAELRTLVEDACESPAINESIFPATVSTMYWSSSPYVRSDNVSAAQAWYISFIDGAEFTETKSNTYAVRLVRAGH